MAKPARRAAPPMAFVQMRTLWENLEDNVGFDG
jgi:hypothetical protein